MWSKTGLEVFEVAVRIPGKRSVWMAAGFWQLWLVYRLKHLRTIELGDRVPVGSSVAEVEEQRMAWELEG